MTRDRCRYCQKMYGQGQSYIWLNLYVLFQGGDGIMVLAPRTLGQNYICLVLIAICCTVILALQMYGLWESVIHVKTYMYCAGR